MKNKILVFLIISVGALFSCNDFTEGINENPNEFTSSPAELLIGQANLAMVKLLESQSSRLAGIYTDQFTGSDRQYITYNNYIATAGDFDDDWDDLYVDGFAQAKEAEKKAKEDGNLILQGVAQIIQGVLIAEAAALWGDVPYLEALNVIDYPNPKYDSQASVLAAAQDLFDSGISNVGTVEVNNYGSPVLSGGSWAEIAHSFKARYYMITKEYPKAYTEAKLGISSPINNFLALHGTATGAKNLYFQFIVEQRSGYLTVSGSHLFNLVNGNTTRLLATPGETERAKKYFDGTELNTGKGGYFAEDSSFPIIDYIETKLIEAEAAHRSGEDALTPFNDVRGQLALDYSGSFPDSSSSGDMLLKEILEEKYISLIGSLQVFHDVRRTKNLIGVPVKVNDKTKIPQRFLYPQSEINSNESFPGLKDLFEETPVNK